MTTCSPSSTTTTTTTTQLPRSSPPQQQQQPSKLPSRPRKLLKLSHPSSCSSSSSSSKPPTPSPRRPLSAPNEMKLALTHLRKSEPLLIPLLSSHQPPSFDSFQPPFVALTKSILYQQLAYKAGTSIYSRFISLCGGESHLSPSTLLSLSPSHLRQIGISSRKSSYLHDLARKYHSNILSDQLIISLDDKSLSTMLSMVNGIGSWSVHMFMIFSLHRPDVLPVNDLQVRKGVQLLYGLDHLPRPSQMEILCHKWRPYRSVGAWYMWRLVESKGPASTHGNSGFVSLPHLRPAPLPLPSSQQQQHQHQQTQQQLPTQFADAINGIMNIGDCSSTYAQLN